MRADGRTHVHGVCVCARWGKEGVVCGLSGMVGGM